MVAPNTATVATVVQANHQAPPPNNGYPYYPAAQPQAVQVTANTGKPPAYADVAPAQV